MDDFDAIINRARKIVAADKAVAKLDGTPEALDAAVQACAEAGDLGESRRERYLKGALPTEWPLR